jgi:hypothetical protein
MNINSTIVSKPPVATERDLRRCEAIESLLVQPLGVLPTEIGDSIRPITIGFFQRVSTLLKPDAMRRDLDGNPVELVSDLIDSPPPRYRRLKAKEI